MKRQSLISGAAVIIVAGLVSILILSTTTLLDTDNRRSEGRDAQGWVASDQEKSSKLAASKDKTSEEIATAAGNDDDAFRRLMSRMGSADDEKGRQFWINAMRNSGMTAEEIEEQLKLYDEFTDQN
ncbi:MAG: hypothetical protein AAFY56_22115, partial [Pseudomonadota bacterium]